MPKQASKAEMKKRKFVALSDHDSVQAYRITFECTREDYEIIMQEITAYGNVTSEEIEVLE